MCGMNWEWDENEVWKVVKGGLSYDTLSSWYSDRTKYEATRVITLSVSTLMDYLY
jgi:hypothetical protein